MEANIWRERIQSMGEEIANSVSHGIGLLAALAATPILIVVASQHVGATGIVAASMFGATMILMYLMSTIYHALPESRAKWVFNVLDHCAIYVLIAGTYTPFTLVVLGGGWGWSMFGVIWGLAIVGIVFKAVGIPTLNDIFDELAKPGRDPREKFESFSFANGIEKIGDLRKGMQLPGIVTNKTAFGAFVDIGVHQDGLVHISQMVDRFVKNPADIVKIHQKVTVTVLDVDMDRNRVSLSMKGTVDPLEKSTLKTRVQKDRPRKPKLDKNRKREKKPVFQGPPGRSAVQKWVEVDSGLAADFIWIFNDWR